MPWQLVAARSGRAGRVAGGAVSRAGRAPTNAPASDAAYPDPIDPEVSRPGGNARAVVGPIALVVATSATVDAAMSVGTATSAGAPTAATLVVSGRDRSRVRSCCAGDACSSVSGEAPDSISSAQDLGDHSGGGAARPGRRRRARRSPARPRPPTPPCRATRSLAAHQLDRDRQRRQRRRVRRPPTRPRPPASPPRRAPRSRSSPTLSTSASSPPTSSTATASATATSSPSSAATASRRPRSPPPARDLRLVTRLVIMAPEIANWSAANRSVPDGYGRDHVATRSQRFLISNWW